MPYTKNYYKKVRIKKFLIIKKGHIKKVFIKKYIKSIIKNRVI